MAGIDHRRFPRVTINRPVRIRTSSGTVVQARLVNISQEGVGVFFSAPAEIGVTLELAFTLPIRNREIEIRERCIACYNYLSNQGYIIGFRFVELEAGLRESLREFVATKRSLHD